MGAITTLHSGWGTQFVDYDNDGWKDIFVAQGHVMDNIAQTQPAVRYKEPLLLMRNNKGRFQDVSERSGAPFRVPLAARGAAFGDLDNDGFIDVAINCNNGDALFCATRATPTTGSLFISSGPPATGMASAPGFTLSVNRVSTNTPRRAAPAVICRVATNASTSGWGAMRQSCSWRLHGPVGRSSASKISQSTGL